jgi:prephenate dehydratase
MDSAKLKENVKRVAFCGGMDPRGYSAAATLFPDITTEAFPTFEKTYESVLSDECQAAVLPFDNSEEGENGRVLDLIFAGDLNMIHTFQLRFGNDTQRYAVMSKKECDPNSEDPGFMLMFTVRDEVGALLNAVKAISDHGFNMRIMRSRPLKGVAWKYYFYVEARGIVEDENGRAMMEELKEVCESFKLVGMYSIVD